MQSWTEIKKIVNPTESEQLEAVALNWYAISLIENPTVKVQKAAFEKNVQAILYIKNGLSKDLVKSLNEINEFELQLAINADPNILKFITNKNLLKSAIGTDWKIVKNIENATDELWAYAVSVNEEAFKMAPRHSDVILMAMVEKNPSYLQEIEFPSVSVIVTAVKKDYKSFEYVSIKHRTESVQLAVVQTDWRCIQFLERANEKVQMEAVRLNKDAFTLIKNPCDAVKEFCK